ncbi:MAG: hypothetical protein Q9170_006302 [Blastenia crenularia]
MDSPFIKSMNSVIQEADSEAVEDCVKKDAPCMQKEKMAERKGKLQNTIVVDGRLQKVSLRSMKPRVHK